MKHFRWEKDARDLVWLTFDKAGGSAKENFIAGADVNEFVKFASADEALAFTRKGWDMTQKLRDLPFPTTAMVNGFCMGGGLELALACKYRVALDDPTTR